MDAEPQIVLQELFGEGDPLDDRLLDVTGVLHPLLDARLEVLADADCLPRDDADECGEGEDRQDDQQDDRGDRGEGLATAENLQDAAVDRGQDLSV